MLVMRWVVAEDRVTLPEQLLSLGTSLSVQLKHTMTGILPWFLSIICLVGGSAVGKICDLKSDRRVNIYLPSYFIISVVIIPIPVI